MGNDLAVSSFEGGQFNTLAQSGATLTNKFIGKRPIIVNGSGTELNNEAIWNRAKKKSITQKLTLSLIDVGTKKGRTKEHLQIYWNTWHCLNRIHSTGGKLYGKYCKNRFCPVCCGIRKAEIINNYLPIIATWRNPHFVTLTVKSVSANQLKKTIDDMVIAFTYIKDKYRKWHTKGKSIKLVGIKSLECNFNPIQKWYNPHFHMIVPDEAIANLLKQEWCKYWGYKIAGRAAQDIKKVANPEKCLIEVVKYSIKIFTDPEMKKKSDRKIAPIIYVSAIDNIIWAMKEHRIFDRFGFNLPTKPKINSNKSQTLTQYDEWLHNPKQTDWVNTEDADELLTGYVLTGELLGLLENIDTISE